MKFTITLSALLFGVLMLTNSTYAETPREQLKQMVEQLQKSPTDNALREKIIKLAQEIKPAPVVPEEVERRMMRGTAALEGVKSVVDYQNAAKEFEQATLAAPWYGDAYFNLGVAQDKAENYEAALRNLKLALLASPNDKEIKALIFKVEYRNEANSPEAKAVRERAKDATLIKSLDGAVFTYLFEGFGGGSSWLNELHIKGDQVTLVMRTLKIERGSGDERAGDYVGRVRSWSAPLSGRRFMVGGTNPTFDSFEIAPDGRTVKNTMPDGTNLFERK